MSTRDRGTLPQPSQAPFFSIPYTIPRLCGLSFPLSASPGALVIFLDELYALVPRTQP
jgi:hypothetical protein